MSQISRHQIVCAEAVNLLRQERERRKLSRYAVAKLSGVSQSMLSLVERGLRNPTLELLLKIADGIGTDFAVILKMAQKSAPRSKKK